MFKGMAARFLLGRGLGSAQEFVSKTVRHGIGVYGGMLVNAGYASGDDVSTVLGAVGAILSVGWSVARIWLSEKVEENL